MRIIILIVFLFITTNANADMMWYAVGASSCRHEDGCSCEELNKAKSEIIALKSKLNRIDNEINPKQIIVKETKSEEQLAEEHLKRWGKP